MAPFRISPPLHRVGQRGWCAFLKALSGADCSASIAGIEEAGATDYAVCLHMEVLDKMDLPNQPFNQQKL